MKLNVMLQTVVAILASIVSANAYLVGPAISLDKMTGMADLVVKATAISTVETNVPSFESIQGFAPSVTTFKVISIFKGEPGSNIITFQHYAQASGGMAMFMPQHYEFTNGQSYILFAKKADAPNVFIQLWKNHTAKEDEGVLRAADDSPLKAKTVKEACWEDLLEMRASTNADDVVYALRQLDQMSAGKSSWWFGGLTDFPRADVIELVRPLLTVQEKEKILKTAIEIAGSRNPYIGSGPEHWLVTVGKGHLPALGALDPHFDNSSGRLVWHELAAIADSNVSPDIRSSAIRALGRTQVAEVTPLLERWAKDSEMLVRQAALVLLADVPNETSQRLIQAAAEDNAIEIRESAAQAIGFGQLVPLLPELAKLLKDNSPQVRKVAAMSLLSFPATVSGDLLRQNINGSEYHTLFVNALASVDPTPYVADLQEIIIKNSEPTNWWGGLLPAADSWNILFKYIQAQPQSELQSGKFDSSLNALEKLQWFSSSEPRDLYALYVQRRLVERAKTFREHCRQSVTYDIDYYFKMVDQSPETYQRD